MILRKPILVLEFYKCATFLVFQVEVANQELMEQDIEVEEQLDVGNPQLYAGND